MKIAFVTNARHTATSNGVLFTMFDTFRRKLLTSESSWLEIDGRVTTSSSCLPLDLPMPPNLCINTMAEFSAVRADSPSAMSCGGRVAMCRLTRNFTDSARFLITAKFKASETGAGGAAPPGRGEALLPSDASDGVANGRQPRGGGSAAGDVCNCRRRLGARAASPPPSGPSETMPGRSHEGGGCTTTAPASTPRPLPISPGNGAIAPRRGGRQ
mmetsp:Transcript_102002/g.295159  ORF Transcript_102002/g.295159 Transcript_102002/m.295159 type:complete len:214 (+) Transcript_102002:1018-1659(+)